MTQTFQLVDVFGTQSFTGNPLAVVAGADDLSTEDMLRITRWLNFSETSFILPPTDPAADYRVRIFTPARELPFAGHPTLGTCHAWLDAGGRARDPRAIVQECGIGLITVRRDGDLLAFAAPPILRGGKPTDAELAQACAVLRIDPGVVVDAQWVDNGPGWIAVMLESADAVRAVRPSSHHADGADIGLVGPHAAGAAAAYEIRALFTDQTGALREDPVTGSLNASIGQWLFASGRIDGDRYIASQGANIGHDGRIHVTRDAQGQVWVGGRTATLYAGQVRETPEQ